MISVPLPRLAISSQQQRHKGRDEAEHHRYRCSSQRAAKVWGLARSRRAPAGGDDAQRARSLKLDAVQPCRMRVQKNWVQQYERASHTRARNNIEAALLLYAPAEMSEEGAEPLPPGSFARRQLPSKVASSARPRRPKGDPSPPPTEARHSLLLLEKAAWFLTD